MKKIILSLSLLLTVSFMTAQNAEKENLKQNEAAAARKTVELPNGWKKFGQISFLFNQSAFNNAWMAGGTSSIAGNINGKIKYSTNGINTR